MFQEADLQAQNGARTAGLRLDYVKSLYRDGCALLEAGQHQRAADVFFATLAEAPEFYGAAQNLGCCLVALGRLEEATECYALVVRLCPDDAGARFNLGCVLLAAGEPADAIDSLREAVRLDPGVAKHYGVLGHALIAADRKAEALAVMWEAARLDGTNPAVLATLAGLLVDDGQFEAAAGAAMHAVEVDPESMPAQASLARALHGLGHDGQALAPALAAVRLAPGDGSAAATLGAIRYALGHHAEAVLHCRRATRLDPSLHQARSTEIAALQALGRLAAVSSRRSTALDDLDLPSDLPRRVVAMVGQNENGILRSVSRDFMDLLPAHGLSGHVVDMADEGWMEQLIGLVTQGVLFAWGSAGIGARLQHGDANFWDAVRVPFISVLADSPCWMPANHHVPSRYVANGYMYRDWLDVQRRLIRSPQISGLLRHSVLPNPVSDERAWRDRPRRMVFVKTGCNPGLHQAKWETLPRRFRAVLEDSAASALQQGVRDISDTVLRCLDAHDLFVEARPDILFSLMQEVDVYVRDYRSTALARALLDLPAEIIGRGWEHVARPGCKARFRPAIDAARLAGLYSETQFLLNTMPNFAHGTHERVLNGFAAGCCVVTNQNADMQARFGHLPSYFGIDTESADLAGELADLCHREGDFEGAFAAAHDLVETDHAPEFFIRSMVDLALEARAFAG